MPLPPRQDSRTAKCLDLLPATAGEIAAELEIDREIVRGLLNWAAQRGLCRMNGRKIGREKLWEAVCTKNK